MLCTSDNAQGLQQKILYVFFSEAYEKSIDTCPENRQYGKQLCGYSCEANMSLGGSKNSLFLI